MILEHNIRQSTQLRNRICHLIPSWYHRNTRLKIQVMADKLLVSHTASAESSKKHQLGTAGGLEGSGPLVQKVPRQNTFFMPCPLLGILRLAGSSVSASEKP